MARDLLVPPALGRNELLDEPAFLQRAQPPSPQPLAQGQGLRRRQRPQCRLGRVVPEPRKGSHALEALHDDEPLPLGHDHDRGPLALLARRRHRAGFPSAVARHEPTVAKVQLLELYLHLLVPSDRS